MSYVFSLIAALVLLSILVTLHELGHYLVGRKLGLPVIEFAVGFGPKLLGFERNGIQYSLRALPLGGYCAFAGEDSPEEDNRAKWDGKRADSLNDCPAWRRLLMQMAGPAMNILTAYICAVVLLGAIGLPVVVNAIKTVVPDGPAYTADILPGDEIVSIGGVSTQEIATEIAKYPDTPVEVQIKRDGELLSTIVTPQLDAESQSIRIGVEIAYSYDYRPMSFGQSFVQAGAFCWDMMKTMVEFLRGLIFQGQGAGDVAGVVGTVSIMAEQTSQSFQQSAKSGFFTVLYLCVMLSMNLGIINLLPVPALDGGRIVFTVIEMIIRRPISRKVEGVIHTTGFVLLLGLMAVLFFKDIAVLIGGGFSL